MGARPPGDRPPRRSRWPAGDVPPPRGRRQLPLGDRVRRERDLSARAPRARQACGAVRAGGHERRAAQHSRSAVRAPAGAAPGRCSRRTARRMGCPACAKHLPPLGRGDRIGLGLDERHIGPRASAQRAATGQVEMPLRTPRQGDRRRAQRVLQARKRLRGHRAARVLAAPAARDDDRHLPAPPLQLAVHLLVDVHHRRMADRQQPPSALCRGRRWIAAHAARIVRVGDPARCLVFVKPSGRRGGAPAMRAMSCRDWGLWAMAIEVVGDVYFL